MKRLREDGFTLIEIAIAVVVIALLLGSLLGPLSVRIEQADRQETQALLAEIKEALYGFAVTNGRLPCPDTNGDGAEDGPPPVCADHEGELPYVNLGVAGTDAWDRNFFYSVTQSFADDISQNSVAPPPSCVTLPAQASFALCSDGDLDVLDGTGGSVVARNVPAVIVSYGANGGVPPTSPHETENWRPPPPADPNPTAFVSRGYSQNPGTEFDDLVAWISPHILKNRMIAAGRLP